jgi:hypothetical protein
VTDRPARRVVAGRLLPVALFALLVVSVYAEPLFFRRNFAGRDLAVYNFPMEKAMHGAYARGRLPLWMPEISGGRPLAPNPNAGAMYPVRPLLSVLPFALAMRLFPVLHWIAAGIGMILLLRSLGASGAGAWLGAVTYVFSGVGVAEVFYPNLHPGMTLLPWVVWTVARQTGSVCGRVVFLSFLYGLLFLAGDVFTIGMAILGSCLWILIEMERRERWRELGLLAAALALAGLLAAPQILATLLWVPDTNRAALGMQLRESLFFSIHPLRLVELVVPFPFGASWSLDDTGIWGWPVFRYKGMGMFTSLYAGAFAVIALVATRKTRLPGFRFGRLLFLIALVISVPPSLVPRAWEKLPSPLPLRNPEKFSVVLVFALAVVAGLAFEQLRSATPRHRWTLGIAAGLAALAGAAALFPGPIGAAAASVVGDERYAKTASEKLPGALAEGGLLWMATVVALDRLRNSSRAALVSSLALLTIAPIAANRKVARTLTELEVFSPTPFARRIGRLDPTGAFRTLGESLYSAPSALDRAYPDDVYTESGRRTWIQNAQALWGRGSVFNNDFDVGDFSRMQALRRLSVAAAAYRDSQAFYGSFALRWGVRFRDQKPLAGYRRFGGDCRQDFDEMPDALPDIRLARSWVEEPGVLDALTRVPRLQPEEAVLETGRRARGSARSGIVHVLVKDPERLVVETVTRDPSWLFVLRGFWNYRDVSVDGRPVASVPAQVAFSAVPVPAGRHRVEWEELLPGSGVSRYGPPFWALLSALLLARSRREKNRP